MRAFRPSRFGTYEEQDVESDRQIKVALYMERAQAGLPLFDEMLNSEESLHEEQLAAQLSR